MKLYFSPGACSLAPHIVLREAGLAPTLVQVDLASHRSADGANPSRAAASPIGMRSIPSFDFKPT